MTDINTQEKKERAVLVGLDAFSLPREENATQESMDELAAPAGDGGGPDGGGGHAVQGQPGPPHFHR